MADITAVSTCKKSGINKPLEYFLSKIYVVILMYIANMKRRDFGKSDDCVQKVLKIMMFLLRHYMSLTIYLTCISSECTRDSNAPVHNTGKSRNVRPSVIGYLW